jgi:hypothetical protein
MTVPTTYEEADFDPLAITSAAPVVDMSGLTLNVPSQLNTFKSRRFTKDKTLFNNFVDSTDAYANSGLKLGFVHLPTGKKVNFKAYITAFNETYSSDWATEPVFGRIDPIVMFKQTTRNITLSFKLVAATPSEGFENLYRLDVLRSFLYPTYIKTSNALTLAQSPLVRVQVMNLLTDGKINNTYDNMFGPGGLLSSMNGALTIIKSMSVAHNLENTDVGVFHPGSSADGPTGVVPKTIEIAIDCMVIHEENMGHIKGNTKGVYGVDLQASLYVETPPSDAIDEDDVNRATRYSAAAQAANDSRLAKWAQARTPRIARLETRKFYRSGEAASGAATSEAWDSLVAAGAAYDEVFTAVEDRSEADPGALTGPSLSFNDWMGP